MSPSRIRPVLTSYGPTATGHVPPGPSGWSRQIRGWRSRRRCLERSRCHEESAGCYSPSSVCVFSMCSRLLLRILTWIYNVNSIVAKRCVPKVASGKTNWYILTGKKLRMMRRLQGKGTWLVRQLLLFIDDPNTATSAMPKAPEWDDFSRKVMKLL